MDSIKRNNTKFVIGIFASNNCGIKTIESIMKPIERIGKLLNLSFNSFSMSYELNKKEQTRSLNFTEKNLEKLYSVDINFISFLSFAVLKSNRDFGDTLLTINLPMNNCETQATIISIIIDEIVLVEKEDAMKTFISLIDVMDLDCFNFQFGIVFPMEYFKLPDFFIMGVGSPNLSLREKRTIDALDKNITQFKNKIWDFFWLNLLKKEFIDYETLTEVIEIVGRENIIEYDNKYLIKIPLSSEEYLTNIDKRYEYIEMLRQVLTRKDKIMSTDEFA
jgi:hypothetical protein